MPTPRLPAASSLPRAQPLLPWRLQPCLPSSPGPSCSCLRVAATGDGRAALLRLPPAPPDGQSARRRSCGLRSRARSGVVPDLSPPYRRCPAPAGRLPPASDNRSPSPELPQPFSWPPPPLPLPARAPHPTAARLPPPLTVAPTSGRSRRRPEPFRGRRRRRSRTQAPLSRAGSFGQHRRSRLPPSNDVSTVPPVAPHSSPSSPAPRSSSSAGASRVLFGWDARASLAVAGRRFQPPTE
ncbi:hypothetical protein ACMD2_17735, partial [Ananas comosus]